SSDLVFWAGATWALGEDALPGAGLQVAHQRRGLGHPHLWAEEELHLLLAVDEGEVDVRVALVIAQHLLEALHVLRGGLVDADVQPQRNAGASTDGELGGFQVLAEDAHAVVAVADLRL